LNAPSDTNFYKIVTPLDVLPGTVTIRIETAGKSLLLPTLSVYNAKGALVARQSATSPFSNDVSVTLSGAWPLSTYYFEVSSASGDVFGVGGYSAQVSYKYPLSSIVGIVPSLLPGVVNTVDHLNPAIASATILTAPFNKTSDQRFDYLYQANIVYGGDADYYQFQAPSTPSGSGAYALDAIVWQTEPNGLVPVIHLFDANGNPLAVQVLANNGGTYSVQFTGVTPGEVFYVEVAAQTASGPGSTGGYVYGVKFNDQPETPAPLLGSDVLPSASSTASGVLALNQNGVFYFELAAANSNPSVSSNVVMTVYDDGGNAVTTLTAVTGGPPVTEAVYLPAGTYTIVYAQATSGPDQPVTFWLDGMILSDPIGPYYSGSGPPPSSSTTTTPAGPDGGTTTSTTTFASSGASVSIRTPSGTTSMPIPAPGTSTTQTFTTTVGPTTITLTTTADGNTTLTMTTPSANTITDTMTTSGTTSTETLSTSDGIQATIITPATTKTTSYSASSSGPPPPPPYTY
jgi:hypothetical protein